MKLPPLEFFNDPANRRRYGWSPHEPARKIREFYRRDLERKARSEQAEQATTFQERTGFTPKEVISLSQRKP